MLQKEKDVLLGKLQELRGKSIEQAMEIAKIQSQANLRGSETDIFTNLASKRGELKTLDEAVQNIKKEKLSIFYQLDGICTALEKIKADSQNQRDHARIIASFTASLTLYHQFRKSLQEEVQVCHLSNSAMP